MIYNQRPHSVAIQMGGGDYRFTLASAGQYSGPMYITKARSPGRGWATEWAIPWSVLEPAKISGLVEGGTIMSVNMINYDRDAPTTPFNLRTWCNYLHKSSLWIDFALDNGSVNAYKRVSDITLRIIHDSYPSKLVRLSSLMVWTQKITTRWNLQFGW